MNKKLIYIVTFLALVIVVLLGLLFIPHPSKNTVGPRSSVPYIQSISPTGLPQGSVAVNLKVSGNNFTEQSIINWNGNSLVTDTSHAKDGFLTAQLSADLIAHHGNFPVSVSDGKNISNSINFVVAQTVRITPRGFELNN